MSISKEDRAALLDSEVFRELEKLTKKAQQTLADKIVQSPSAQQAIRDGIAKALENRADDMEDEHEDIKANIKKLDNHVLIEFCKMFDDEIKMRGLDKDEYKEEFEEKEEEETPEDKEKEEEEMEEVFAHVVKVLTKLANKSADEGNTEAAYLIERTIQKIS
jgi:hypothetical protein